MTPGQLREWAESIERGELMATDDEVAYRLRKEAALLERHAELEKIAEELIRRLDGIADWRSEAHAYDADVGNEPRTFCEDVAMIEQSAKDAIDDYRAWRDGK